MIKLLFLIFLSFLLLNPIPIQAIYDPLSVSNNKFGIHIIDENDLYNAAKLVNSSGGDWGYVTIVIREDDRNINKWQNIFNRMKELHLIPIIRLATTPEGNNWKRPRAEDASSWTGFFSQLDWVTKNRYIIIFNEPNHAKEWGGSVDPNSYAEVFCSFADSLKKDSINYFILPAGLDASAPNSSDTLDEVTFLSFLNNTNCSFFDKIDGWVSHSYPNPGFIGRTESTGRGSIRTYKWELDLLKIFGINKNLPVFLTETGWPHQEGTEYNGRFYDADKVAELIEKAATEIWNDQQIAAITPFILNYQSYPFSQFSWQKPGSNGDFYPQYLVYQSIKKDSGKPLLAPTYEHIYNYLPLDFTTRDNQQITRMKVAVSFSLESFF